MLLTIFLFSLIILRLVIGVRLWLTGRSYRLPNLIWLSASMFLAIVALLFAPTEGNPLGNLPISIWMFFWGNFASLIPIIFFNQLTFYKDKKSPTVWVWIVFIASFAIGLYGVTISESNYNQSAWVAAYVPGVLLIWAWHGWLAYQALNKVVSQPAVESWVKTRYRLMIAYAIVLALGAFVSFIRIVFAGGGTLSVLGSLTGLFTLLAQITSVTLMFLVWVMPEQFRLWLNRNHQALVEQQVSEQASGILNMLGTAMSQETKLPKTLALVAIRKTIGQEINTSDSKEIEAHVITLGYQEWYAFLNSPKLDLFLREVANVSPRDVVENAKLALIENQSIFTLQAK